MSQETAMEAPFTSPAGVDALMQTSPRPDLVVARGEGSYLFDESGRRYLDLVQGWAVNALGHRPAVVVEALARQAGLLVNAGPAFHTRSQLNLVAALVDAGALDRVFLCSTGAEANEGAIKLARKWAQRHRPGAFEIITTDNAFHGRTLATMAATGKPGWDALFPPIMPGFVKVPFGDVAALAEAIGPRTAAVMIEPIQGEAGVVVPPAGYLKAARELCRERNVLFVADEIQSGLGRTGRTLAIEHDGITPDVLILGKALGGGITPLSAVVANWEIMKVIRPGEHGSTFGGNPLACAVGREVLAILAEGEVQARAASMGTRFLDTLRSANLGKVKEIRGIGLWAGIELLPGGPSSREVCEAMLAEGLLVKDTHETTVRLSPPLVITDEELDWALERAVKVLS
jgi:ornithine--oxo-acid transaminase